MGGVVADLPRKIPHFLCLSMLMGCLDEMLEAPYVLATGLGEASDLTPTAAASMFVASNTGLWDVSGSGVARQMWTHPTEKVSTHIDRVWFLADGFLWQAPFPISSGASPFQRVVEVPGAVDVVAGCDDQVIIATADTISVWDGKQMVKWADSLNDVQGLSLGPSDPCGGVLAISPRAVLRVTPQDVTAFQAKPTRELQSARVGAIDAQGALWVIDGDSLGEVTRSGWRHFASHLEEATAIHFGVGDLFQTDIAYITTRDGHLEYLQVPADRSQHLGTVHAPSERETSQ